MFYQEKREDNFSMDMRQNIFNSSPLLYKVGNSTFHVQARFVTIVAVLGLMCLIVVFLALPSYHVSGTGFVNSLYVRDDDHSHAGRRHKYWFSSYNSTYPITPPIYSEHGFAKYRIAIISDLDTHSKDPKKENTWFSYLRKGYLSINLDTKQVTNIEWDSDPIILSSQFAYGGRGMELSELVTFNGKLYTVDDRTGIVYNVDLTANKVIPWVILPDGNGDRTKGFKSEWATVKDETLIVGGLGKEWTSPTGKLINHDPQFVKTIDVNGFVQHHDWSSNYAKIRSAENIRFPGYMIHESCAWSEIHQKWIFLPRRASLDMYNEVEDERKGTNLMIQATEGFETVDVHRVGDFIETHGFSSFKFVPGTKEEVIVALKSEEVNGKAATYIMAFNMNGDVLFPEKKIADFKFEGIEFI